jgi:ABC-type transport system involved in cytochrome bd biosynthesis fused ATPase/permease subunit
VCASLVQVRDEDARNSEPVDATIEQRCRVLFEGVDVRELRLADLRGALAMVAQEPVLFSGTVRDNIGYGKEGATFAEIEQAAKDAFARRRDSPFRPAVS